MLEFERWQEPQLAINAALDRLQSRLWTKLPCVVTAVDLVNQLVTVQPTVMGVQRNVDASGNVTWSNIQLPLLPMVPIKYPSGGGYTMTFPVAVGDEGTVSFASRCIDNWWQSSGVQPQLTSNSVGSLRQHDLSDGFFELGGRSLPNILSGVSSSSVQIRSDDGTAAITFDKTQCKIVLPSSEATLVLNSSGFNLTFPGGSFNVDSSGNITNTGNTSSNGDVTAQASGSYVSLTNHIHTGVKPGTGSTAAPEPGT